MSDAEPSGAFSAFLDSLKEREQRESHAPSEPSRRYGQEQINILEALSEHTALAQDKLSLYRMTWDRLAQREQEPGTVSEYAQDVEATLTLRRGVAEQLRILLRHLESWLENAEDDSSLATMHKRLRTLYSQIMRETSPNSETVNELERRLNDLSETVEERILGP